MKVFISLLALVCLAGCTHNYQSYVNQAHEMKEGAVYSYEGNTVRYRSKSLVVEAAYLTPENTETFFSYFKDGKYKDPFPPGSFMVFELTMENTCGKNILFNPGMAILCPDKDNPFPSEDYTSFYTALEMANAEDIEARMDAYKAACFDGSVTLRPGMKLQGLVAFRRAGENPDKAVLVLENIYMGYESRAVPFLFEGIVGGK